MNSNHSKEQQIDQTDYKQGIIRWVITAFIFTILIAACLFLSAGTLGWWMGWVYIGVAAGIQVLDALVLIPISPDLLGERSRYQRGAKLWDEPLSRLMATIGPISIWIVSGLDYRFSWSPDLPLWIVIIAMGFVILGGLITLWAMASNRFFVGMVRIQEERGHKVVTSGPYKHLRHPGYLGSVFFLLFTPLMLGSLVALIPALLIIFVVFLRTYLEDNTLKGELVGYQQYASEVRYRLIPGVW
jgi:protein-S-isoprenylcysteine O-methyltransferase Ste14